MVLMFFCAFLIMRLEIFRDIQRYLEISRDIRRRTISNPRFCLKMSVPLQCNPEIIQRFCKGSFLIDTKKVC